MSDSGDQSAGPRDVSASDPNGGGPDGLAGRMGVSSERTGRVRGTPGTVTHGTEDTSADSSRDEDDSPEEPRTGESPAPPDPLPG